MPRPSPVRDAVQDRVLGGDRHDWGIDDLLADLREAGVAAEKQRRSGHLRACVPGGNERVG